MDCTQNLRIQQGKTFTRVIRWETDPLQYAAITAIDQAAPVEITAPGHGIPDGWPVAVVSVKGMTEINAKNLPPRSDEWHRAYVVGPDTIHFADVNAADYHAYVSGGYLMSYTPVDLVGFTARMKIKDRIGGTVLASFESPTDITIDTANYTITLVIAADATAAYTWLDGVYDLEMVSPAGVVTAILSGEVSVRPEVTT